MKTKELLEKMKALLSADQRKQIAKYESLEKVLGKLETKEVALRGKLNVEDDEERREELVRKIEVIEAQRKKGAELKKELDALGGV
jgi:hypothetical protein